MFDDLIESKPKRVRTAREMLVAGVVHGALITGAVLVTEAAAEPALTEFRDTTSFVLKSATPTPPPDRLPELATASPVPRGFQTVVPPRQIPISIPPIDLTDHFDASRYTARGTPDGSPDGVPSLPGQLDSVMGAQFTVDQVDDPVTYLGGPEPLYPAVLKAAGVEASVTLEFVVDREGKVENGSIRVVGSTHVTFEAPSIDAVRQSRFTAAKIRGQKVRQLVRQVVRFTIRR